MQYVTNSIYLCNSLMLFESLHRLGTKAERAMMYPSQMMSDPATAVGKTDDAKLLIKARDLYNVKLVPIAIQHRDGADCTSIHPMRLGFFFSLPSPSPPMTWR